VQFELSKEGLRIRGDLYARTIPAAALFLDNAKSLDLSRDREYRLGWRTNGAGLPGYQSGWFKLKNGEKALVFVTNKKRVAYVPTRNGYSVLLSVEEPDKFIQACRDVIGQE
jgi:hypothetical protein